ncbi:hypothetical protein ACFL3G_07095 [Planctomycetota bacterium]
MAQIICLANSYKGVGQRCVAGIDMCIKEWVRPFNPKGHEGAIGHERLINGKEPMILDVLEIPIGGESENYGCQPENRILLQGRWKKTGVASTEDVLQYIEESTLLLHNDDKKVDSSFFNGIPKEQWKSLQLIRPNRVNFSKNPWNDWECRFIYSRHFYDLKIIDPVVVNRLKAGEKISQKCILIISMGGPYDRNNSGIKQCWKMVAGVIEL